MSAISNYLPTPPDNFTSTLTGTGITSGGLSFTLTTTTGMGTEGVGVFYKKDSGGLPVANTVEFVHWTGVTGTTVTLSDSSDRGLEGSYATGTGVAHDNGDTFEVWVHQQYYKGPRTGFLAAHNDDGSHQTGSIAGDDLAVAAITLGESAITGDQNLTGSFADLTGMSVGPVTVPAGGRRVRLDCMLVMQNNTAAGSFNVAFLEDGSIVRQFTQYLAASGVGTAFPFWFTKVPTAGSHTYKVQASWGGTGTGIAKATSDLHAFLA